MEIVYKLCIAGAKLTERIRKALEDYDAAETPPKIVQLYALYEWPQVKSCAVGKNMVAPLEPDGV